MEEALYDTPMFREFAGLDMGEEHLPDESTIPRLRHLIEANHLSVQILATVNATQTDKGLLLKLGTVVDATLIAAPGSTNNQGGERDPEMHQIKKGNQWHFGMKPMLAWMRTRCLNRPEQRRIVICAHGHSLSTR